VSITQPIHLRRQNLPQSALRKFQRFTGSLWAGSLNLDGVMKEDWCCYRGNFPRTRLSGSWLSWLTFAKAKSGLVPMFHRWEKLDTSFSLGQPKVVGCCPKVKTLTV